ncbi:NAD(P)-dependent oxidoreductase [Sphingomonas corticis]|uniref:NAD(P)-dependent oxidoreductase n=1 Tax=Sphingomonas corticis TaxID=2722791 RepID=A0ABX1CS34_9SPHN|nr:NAD(P)-dependent oxidoreductase [Sphingomonas corticis]NJR80304.1 NAD(P)-dependent oxidoreductase [Sphingomonas corticis]
MRVAFLGLGHMGESMAANLVRSGVDVLAWNRSEPALRRLAALGAATGASARSTLRGAEVALLMLADERAVDEVLGRGTAEFAGNVAGRLVVHMGTTSPAFSASLGEAVREAGGRYVEAPVSGSRVPAEQGMLVGMVAGGDADVALVRELVAPMCRRTFACGAVPGALTMKLAVNLFLIAMVTGLVEASHFAANSGLDLDLFRSVLDAGPMASDVSRVKLDKLVRSDMSPQAGLSDVLMNCGLVADAARAAGIATPLLDQSHQLYAEAEAMGLGDLDMIGVSGAIEELTAARRVTRIMQGR